MLAQYQVLRRNGLTDDRIILVVADDLARNTSNRTPGAIQYESGGPNIYEGVQVDYRLNEVNAGDLLSILSGAKSDRLPRVIESNKGDNVYVFLAGHGNEKGLYLELNQPIPTAGQNHSILGPDDLAQTLDSMFVGNRYRRMFLAVESCYGGIFGTKIKAPGIVLISGANPFENSLSANYDSTQRVWLADAFAYQLWRALRQNSDVSLDSLHQTVYLNLQGSHATLFAPRFGQLFQIKIQEFIVP